MGFLEEMDNFKEIYNFPRLNHGETDNVDEKTLTLGKIEGRRRRG